MSIKAIVSKIAAYFLTREDFTALAGDSSLQELVTQASQTLRTVGTNSSRQSAEFRELSNASEAFVLKANGSSTLNALASNIVQRSFDKKYFVTTTIQRIVEEHFIANGQPVAFGKEADLVSAVAASLEEAKGITNFIKRRAVVRAGVKAHLPEISTDRSAALVELLLQLS